MFAHRLHPSDVRSEIRAARFHLDGAKALGEIVVGLLRSASTERSRSIQRDVKRRERKHRWSATSAVMQGPPDVMQMASVSSASRPSINSGIPRRRMSAIARPLRPTV